MPRLNAILLAGAALACASAASAAPEPQWHTAIVDLPDGSQAEIDYVGDIVPRVRLSVPVVQKTEAAAEPERGRDVAYGGIPRARRVIESHPQADTTRPDVPPQPAPPRLIVSGEAPKGASYEYSLVTTGPDGRTCTQKTEWISRGKGKEPEVRQTDTGAYCADMATHYSATPYIAPQPMSSTAPPSAPPPATSAVPSRLRMIDPDSI